MMAIDIPALPSIPEGLRLAAAQGSLVPFVGAGLSKLAGCPDWKEFAARSLGFFIDRGRVDYTDYKGRLRTLLIELAKHGQRPAALRLANQMRDLKSMPEVFAELSSNNHQL